MSSKIIAVAGKGGVGKTTVSAAIVRILTEQYPAQRILAIDADLVGVGVHVDFGRRLVALHVLLADRAAALDGDKPALAFCRSGTRSTILWALSQSGKQSERELLRTAADAGYDLSGVVPLMRSLAGDSR